MSVAATLQHVTFIQATGPYQRRRGKSNIYTRTVGNELSPCGRYCVLLLMRTPEYGGCRNECYMREPRGVCVSAVLQRRPFPTQVTLERSNTSSIKLIAIAVA